MENNLNSAPKSSDGDGGNGAQSAQVSSDKHKTESEERSRAKDENKASEGGESSVCKHSAACEDGENPRDKRGGLSEISSEEEKTQPRHQAVKGADKKRKGKKKKRIPAWLSWGLIVLFLSFVLSVLFSLLTEIAVNDSPIYVCIAVLVVLLVLNIGCDIIANAVVSCSAEGFNAMASRKIRGAKRAVTFCRNAEKIGSIFSDVIGDICGIVSGSAGAVLAGYFIVNDSIQGMAISIMISAVISALTVGGKAFGKPFSIKYNSKIAFGFARFTTFFVKEK